MAKFMRIGVAAAVVLLAALVAAGRAAGTQVAPPAAPGAKLEVKRGLWSWKGPKTGNEHWVHVPENYKATAPCPILVLAHGKGSSGAEMIHDSTCDGAVSRGWIAVAPTWHPELKMNLDDEATADETTELIHLLEATYNVDKKVIVSSGYDLGGKVSLRGFGTYSEIYSFLVSQSSAYSILYLGNPFVFAAHPPSNHRPVLLLCGEQDRADISAATKHARFYFAHKGYPTTIYTVPGGLHQTEPQQTWSWLDTVVLQKRSDEVKDAIFAVVDHKTGPEAAAVLAPFQNLTVAATEKKIGDSGDPFLKDWDRQYNEAIKTMTDYLARSRALYQEAVEIGRKQLAAAKFDPAQKEDGQKWILRYKTRWAAVPDLCRAADAAYEKTYGEKWPEYLK